MNRKLGLLAGVLAIESISDQAIFSGNSYEGKNRSYVIRKSNLTPNQKKLRLRAKRARIARRKNRL